MNSHYKRRLTVLTLATLLLALSCSNEPKQDQPVITTSNAGGSSTAPPAKEVEQRQHALVRFIHAVPGLAAVDVFANDAKVFSETRYKTVTPYSEVASQSHSFRLRLAGQEGADALAEEKESFTAGKHYTLIAVPASATGIFSKGDGQNVELRLLSDELVAPALGKTKVRVIDASPDLNELDLYATGRADALLKGVKFGSDTKYAEVEPLNGALEVRRGGENVATLNVPDVRIESDKLYTIFVVGRTKGAAKLESVVVEDRIGKGASAQSSAAQ